MASYERPGSAPLSPRSERVKKVAALSGRSARVKEKAFRLEGPQSVRSLLEHTPESVVALYATDAARVAHPDIAALADDAGITIWDVEDSIINAMVREQGNQSVTHPQGFIAVARPTDVPWKQLVSALPDSGPVTVVVCERLQDPGNAGVILRTADAAGAAAVFFGEDSVDVFAPKVVRASVGSVLTVPLARKTPIPELIRELRERGVRIAATSPYGDQDLFASDVAPRTAWVFGNEAQGLEERTMADCDDVVRIPLFGRAESLNLATAATLCLYESARTHGRGREDTNAETPL